MVKPIELANYIIYTLGKKGITVSHLKLQKLMYYVYVWYLIYAGEPLFDEKFEAWLHGAVIKSVWNTFKNYSIMNDSLPIPKNATLDVTDEQKQIIDDVLEEYGDKTGYHLECLCHSEEPWKKARRKGNNSVISDEDIISYYGGLLNE